jgi:hypothetical protein
MARKSADSPCVVCDPDEAQGGEYCEAHRNELHRLDHQYETLFRLQRTSRGKDHETYDVFMQGACDPCGRVLVTETDPENLVLTVLLANDVNLETRLTDYDSLRIEKTYGDQLRERIEAQIIHSWYGNARACVDVFHTTFGSPQHWDVAAREQNEDDEEEDEAGSSPHGSQGGKHSVH